MADELSWGWDGDEATESEARPIAGARRFGVHTIAAMRVDRAQRPLLIGGGALFAVALFVPWLRLTNFYGSNVTADANAFQVPFGMAVVLLMPLLITLATAAVSVPATQAAVTRRVLAWAAYGLGAAVAVVVLAIVFGAADALSFPNASDPNIHLRYGWFVALLAVGLLVSAVAAGEPALASGGSAARAGARHGRVDGAGRLHDADALDDAGLDLIVESVHLQVGPVEVVDARQPVTGLTVGKEHGGPPVSELQVSAERTARIWRDAR
jgi:hypothetical protein